MLIETFIIKKKKLDNLGETDKIKIFNKEITESLDNRIANAEYELLKLSDMLILNVDLLEEKN